MTRAELVITVVGMVLAAVIILVMGGGALTRLDHSDDDRCTCSRLDELEPGPDTPWGQR